MSSKGPRRDIVAPDRWRDRAADLLLLSGCAVGPDFHAPAAPDNAGYTKEPLPPQTASTRVLGGEAQRFVPGGDLSGDWWTLFRSRPLNEMIDQALRANPDLQAAQAALRQANEDVYAGQGALFPKLSANAQAERDADFRCRVRRTEPE